MNVLDIIEKLEKLPISQPIKNVMCPSCGREMVKRKNKFGDGYWFGCSGFPSCKKTLKNNL